MLELFEYKDDFINYKKNLEHCIFLDIETSGVRRYMDFAWLIGISFIKNAQIITKQIFCQGIEDEKESLKELQINLEDFDEIVTFNGESFDLPFLKERAKYNNLSLTFPNKSFDLYRYIRKNNKFLMLKDISLQGTEKFLKIKRQDELSGKDTMKLYEICVTTNNQTLKKSLLSHNYYDVKNLPELLKIKEMVNKLCNLDDLYKITNMYRFKDRIIVVLNNPKNKKNLNIYTDTYSIESRLDSIFILLNTKQTIYNKKNVSYLTSTGRVAYYDRLLYTIIKEEINKIVKLNAI